MKTLLIVVATLAAVALVAIVGLSVWAQLTTMM